MVLTIDQNVGRGCPNLVDDVELVRYAYACSDRLSYISPITKAKIAGMKGIGGYGPDLQAVIDANQKVRGGEQDGRVSKLPASFATSGTRYDSKNTFIMWQMNLWMFDAEPLLWPRIDRSILSGPAITATMKKLLTF